MFIQPSLRHLVETCIFPDTKRGLPIKCPNLLVFFEDFATVLIIANECLKVGTILRKRPFSIMRLNPAILPSLIFHSGREGGDYTEEVEAGSFIYWADDKVVSADRSLTLSPTI